MILGAATYTATRKADGDWSTDPGYYTPGAASTFTVVGSLQPASGPDLKQLPEGNRATAVYSLFCDNFQAALEMSDRVSVDGVEYLVIGTRNWTGHAELPYRSYILGEITGV